MGLLIVLPAFPSLHFKQTHQHSLISMKFLLLPEPCVSQLPSAFREPRYAVGQNLTPPPSQSGSLSPACSFESLGTLKLLPHPTPTMMLIQLAGVGSPCPQDWPLKWPQVATRDGNHWGGCSFSRLPSVISPLTVTEVFYVSLSKSAVSEPP